MKPLNIPESRCFAEHAGLWLARPEWLARMVGLYNAGQLQPTAEAKRVIDADSGRPLYEASDDGVALIGISGVMMRGESKFGGTTSSLRIRRALRAATADPDVKGIMLSIDSLGGTYAGTGELGQDIALAAKSKPIHAYGEGVVASAAYWVAAQAHRFTTSAQTETGSIGVVMAVEDTSEQAAAEGRKVYVVRTDELKGAGIEGAPITEAQLAYWQEMVDASFDQFLTAVSRGRGARLNKDAARKVGGRLYTAKQGMDLGLIDGIETFDEAIGALRSEVRARRRAQEQDGRARSRRAAIAELS